MAFPAYQCMNIPDVQADASDQDCRRQASPGELFDILPPITSLFLENITISDLLARIGLEISSQPVDDIPVILATLLKMDIPNQIDSCFKTHGI